MTDLRERAHQMDRDCAWKSSEQREEITYQALIATRREALEEAIQCIPGGDICDPQDVADDIRKLIEESQ